MGEFPPERPSRLVGAQHRVVAGFTDWLEEHEFVLSRLTPDGKEETITPTQARELYARRSD